MLVPVPHSCLSLFDSLLSKLIQLDFSSGILTFCSTRAGQIPLAAAYSSCLRWLARFYLHANAGDRMSWDPVYKFVKQIPRARVLTYGAVARALRLPGGARTAGRAMAGCPSGKGIPWHRVVGAGGKLLIREPYASLQRKLLESEGIQMTERCVNMKLHQWSVPRPKKSHGKHTAKRVKR